MRKLAARTAAALLAIAAAPGVHAQGDPQDREDVSLPYGSVMSHDDPSLPYDPVIAQDDDLLPHGTIITWQDEPQALDYETRDYGGIMEELLPQEQERFRALYGALYQEERSALFALTRELAAGERGILALALLERPVEASHAFLGFVAYLPDEAMTVLAERATTRFPRPWGALIDYTLYAPYSEVAWSLLVARARGGCPDPPYPGLRAYYADVPADGSTAQYSVYPECSAETLAFMKEWYPDTGYILEGQPMRLSDAPWQAQLIRSDEGLALYSTKPLLREELRLYGLRRPDWERRHLCGGVFIGERWVLTAAHCIEGWGVQDLYDLMRVRLGSTRADSGGYRFRVNGAVVHADYRGEAGRWRNDIALLRLGDTVDVAGVEDAAVPAASNRNRNLGSPLEVSGWGVTSVTRNATAITDDEGLLQRYSRDLLGGELYMRDPAVCGDSGAMTGATIFPGQLCAGNVAGVDACRGDSGGPLVLNDAGQRELVGLVSYGAGCGLADTAKVFTDVGYYRDWIASAMRIAQRGEIRRLGCTLEGFSVC